MIYALDHKNKHEPPKNGSRWYKKVVIHSYCGKTHQKPRMNCHFVIDKDGKFFSTWAWDSEVPVNHTSDSVINRMSVAVVVEQGRDSTEQYAALAQILKSLNLGLDDVLLHHDSCPGNSFSLPKLHRTMAQKGG
jgi:hypothetical protein